MAKRSNEFYRLALLGGTDKKTGEILSYGLRETAHGFASSDGFNLRDIGSWSPSQRAKVTKYWHELQNLTAQPRFLFKTRDKAKLEQAQRAVQSEAFYAWKVAFIPHAPGKTPTGKVSKAKPKITFTKDGIRIRERKYTKAFIPLNARQLAADPAKTIRAAIKANAPKAQRFSVMALKNEISGVEDKNRIVARVRYYMMKYDGATPLTSGRHVGGAPKSHAWQGWLTGLMGYEFPKATQQAVSDAIGGFDTERLALQKRRRAMRKTIARKNKAATKVARKAAKSAKVVKVVKLAVKPRKAAKK